MGKLREHSMAPSPQSSSVRLDIRTVLYAFPLSKVVDGSNYSIELFHVVVVFITLLLRYITH